MKVLPGARGQAGSRESRCPGNGAPGQSQAERQSERIACSKVVHGFEGHVREHGFGLNGICQRQGHTGVEREKEERRADRRTDRQTGRRTPGAVGGTWNNHISLRADLLAGRGTGCSSPALSTAPASVDAASSPPQTTRVSSSCARHPRAGSRGLRPPYNLGAPASTPVSRESRLS